MPSESSPLFHRFLHLLRTVLVGLLTLAVVLVALLQLPPVATWVGRRLAGLLPLNAGYALGVGRVSGSWFGGLVLEDVSLTRGSRELARVGLLGVRYSIRELLGTPIRVRQIDVDSAQVAAHREGAGWDIAQALRKPADTTGGAGFQVDLINIRGASLVAEVAPDSVLRMRGLNVVVQDLESAGETTANVKRLDMALAPPGSPVWLAVSTSGRVSADLLSFNPIRIQTERSDITGRMIFPRRLDDALLLQRLDIRLKAAPLAFADVAPLAPWLPSGGAIGLDAAASARGRIVTAQLDASVQDGAIALTGSTELDRGEPTQYRLHGSLGALDPSKLMRAAPAGRISGTIDAGLNGRLDSATGTATVRIARSRIGTTSLEKLDLHADLAYGRAVVSLRGKSGPHTLALNGWIRPFDSIPAYRLTGSAAGLPGTAPVARSLTGEDSDSVLGLRFWVCGRGLALATANLDSRVDLAAMRSSGDRVPAGYATISLDNGRLVARPDLAVAGGRISALATARLGDTVTYRVTRGTIAGVDLGRLLGDTLAAPINGRFSLRGTGTTPAEAAVAASFSLDELRYGERRIDSIVARGRLDRGRATVGLRGALQGGRVAADLVARPFDSTAALDISTVTLDSVDLGTLMGNAALAGPVTLRGKGRGRWGSGVRRVSGEIEVEPSRLGEIAVTSGTLAATLDGQRLTYEASVNTNGGGLALAGDGRPLTESPVYAIRRGRADSLDLGALFGRAGLRSDLNATFTATLFGRGDRAQTALEAMVLPSSFNDAKLEGGRVSLAMRERHVKGEITLTGPDGRLESKVDGRMSATTTALHTTGTLRLEHLARWTGRKHADGRIEGEFDLSTSADSAGLLAVGGSVAALGGVGDIRLFGANLALTPMEGGIQVDTLRIRSNVVQLDGRGAVALRQGVAPGALTVRGRFTDVEPLAALAGAGTVSVDSAVANLRLSGPASHWRFDAQGHAYSVLTGSSLIERMDLGATGVIDSSGVAGVRGDLRVTDAAYGRIAVPELRVAARYDSVVALDASIAIGDSIRLATAVRGTVAGDTIHAVVQRLDLAEYSRHWTLERPASVGLGRRTRIEDLALVSGDRRIALHGVLDLHDSTDATLGIEGLDLDGFRSAGLSPIGGRLDGSFHLAGHASDPSLDGKLGLAIVGSDGKTAGRVGADFEWQRQGLRLKAVATPTAGGTLTVAGTLPYRFTLAPADTSHLYGVERGEVDTLGITVAADSFGLSLFQPLFPPDVAKGLAGSLTADGHIGGRLDAPAARGTLALTGGALTLPALGVSYQKGELLGRLEGQEFHIDRLRILTGKDQVLDGKGVIHLKPLNDPGLDLTAHLRDFQISDSPTLSSIASGDIELRGSMKEPSVTGGLSLGPTDVFVGAEAAAANVEPVELTTDDLRMLARDFGPTVLADSQETASLMSRLRIDVQLRLPRRVWIRRRKPPEADVELRGEMRLTQVPGKEMKFAGRVQPVPGRGSIDLSGRTFRLTGGEITLDGPIDSTRLDVTAEYQVPTQGGGEDNGVVISVAAKGKLDSLSLAFSADPELSQEDILSYIVTGHPGSDNPLESGAGGLSGKQIAFGQLSQALGGAVGRGLGFDVFQIRTDPATGLSLTAGRYLSDRFFLNIKLPLGSGSANTPGENLGPGFDLEYTARRWLRADLRGGSLPAAILFRGRHAY